MLEINEIDVWQQLAQSEKPVVIYGMGNGAEKIISVLKDYNIEVADIFASDEFVRGHSFLGYKVLKYSDVCKKYNVSREFSDGITIISTHINNNFIAAEF